MEWGRRLKKKIKKMRKPEPAVYIVSYPKSGRTWLRFMLCSYLAEAYRISGDISLDILTATRRAGLPLTRFTHDQAYMSRRIRASDLHFDVRRFSGRKVLFLGRDIKDTLVSAYHQATKRNVVFSGGLSAFLRDEQFGTPKIVAFYRMWLTHRQVPTEFLYLAYEEMHREPVAALRKALAFIGETEINEEALQHAVARGSFDNMRKIETGQTAKSSILKPADPNDQNSFKTRKGVVGGHAQELSPEDIAYIDGLSESLQGTAFVRE